MPDDYDVYAGIDPGKRGAIVQIEIEPGYQSINYNKMPFKDSGRIDNGLFWSIFRGTALKRMKICIEKAQPMPKQGVKSMFNYGFHYGQLITMLEISGWGYEEVPPQTWHRSMTKGYKGTSKEKALQAARELFPDEAFLQGKKPHDGLVDALLIAEYGRRKKRTNKKRISN